MNLFKVLPLFLRTAAPGDILVATLGNLELLRPPAVLAAVDLRLPPLTDPDHLDVDGHASIYFHEGTVADIVLPALTDADTLLVPVLQEAPGAGFIRLPALTDADTIVAPVLQVAPADGFIRLPALTDGDTLNTPVVEEFSTDAGLDDYNDPMVADGSVGGRMI